MTFLTKESYKKYFNGFEVSIEYVPKEMNNNKAYYPPEPLTCYKQNVSKQESIKMNVECNTSTAGNQVRMTLLQKYSHLVLCDVRIYAECGNGKYGKNCSNQCSNNCLEDCDKVNGTCLSCKPGWSGPMCMKGKFLNSKKYRLMYRLTLKL
ncbi:protein draper-like [Ruditapes philippinarum]|uniref:protein draper-like n=1 Tax=Ruditapes philippinarum TaxID=129788 RepID=UPI00295B102B|nr:protein draper-like [Ruditapes philippinarum]